MWYPRPQSRSSTCCEGPARCDTVSSLAAEELLAVKLENDQLWALVGVLSPDPGRDPGPVDKLLAALLTHLRRVVTVQHADLDQFIEDQLLCRLHSIGFQRTSQLVSQLRVDWTHRMFLLDEKCRTAWRSVSRKQVRELLDETRQEMAAGELGTERIAAELERVEHLVQCVRHEEASALASTRAQCVETSEVIDEISSNAARFSSDVSNLEVQNQETEDAAGSCRSAMSELDELKSRQAHECSLLGRHTEVLQAQREDCRVIASDLASYLETALREAAEGAQAHEMLENHLQQTSSDAVTREQLLSRAAEVSREMRRLLDKALSTSRMSHGHLRASKDARRDCRERLAAAEAACAADVQTHYRHCECRVANVHAASAASNTSWNETYLESVQQNDKRNCALGQLRQQVFRQENNALERRKIHSCVVAALHTCQARLRRWEVRSSVEQEQEQAAQCAVSHAACQSELHGESALASRATARSKSLIKQKRNEWYFAGYDARGRSCVCFGTT